MGFYESGEDDFRCSVVGVTFNGRQAVVAKCTAGERLSFRAEPDNPEDPAAIQIRRANGEVIGYLPDAIVDDHGERILRGMFEVTVESVKKARGGVLGIIIEGYASDAVTVEDAPETAPAVIVPRTRRELQKPEPPDAIARFGIGLLIVLAVFLVALIIAVIYTIS